jgi:hypothetical protein
VNDRDPPSPSDAGPSGIADADGDGTASISLAPFSVPVLVSGTPGTPFVGIVIDRASARPSARVLVPVLVPVTLDVLVLVPVTGSTKSMLTSSIGRTFGGKWRAIGNTASAPTCSTAAATKNARFRRAYATWG